MEKLEYMNQAGDGDMVDKNSKYYLKSEYKDEIYVVGKGTKLERDLNVEGNDEGDVRELITSIKAKLMP